MWYEARHLIAPHGVLRRVFCGLHLDATPAACIDPSMMFSAFINNSEDEDEELVALAYAGTVLGGSILTRYQEQARKAARKHFLRRRDLLPNPHTNTPWQVLLNGRQDSAYITTMGFDVNTFDYLLAVFKPEWDSWTIPRGDVSRAGAPRLGARSLDAAGALGLVLHYYSSAMAEKTLSLIFALTPSTLNRYLERAESILDSVLTSLPEAQISLPRTQRDYQDLNGLIVARHPSLTGAFASIDGLSLAAEAASDPEIENASYNSWKSGHRINNVIVFAPTGVFAQWNLCLVSFCSQGIGI